MRDKQTPKDVYGGASFPLSAKTNISKFQFDQESGRWRTTLWMCYLQIIIIIISIIIIIIIIIIVIIVIIIIMCIISIHILIVLNIACALIHVDHE